MTKIIQNERFPEMNESKNDLILKLSTDRKRKVQLIDRCEKMRLIDKTLGMDVGRSAGGGL